MKFILAFLGRAWSIAFLLFLGLIVFSSLGGALPDWAKSFLNVSLRIFEDWVGIIVPVVFLIIGINYGNKVGWNTVLKKTGKYFQSNIDDEFELRLGAFSLSKLFLGASAIFVIISLILFNYELRKSPECTIDLLNDGGGTCIVDGSLVSDFRIVVHSGGDESTVNLKVPINIYIIGDEAKASFTNILPDRASTGGSGRYHSNLDYGIYNIPNGRNSTVAVTASNDIEKLNLFEVKLLASPNEWPKKVFGALFLVTLFLSIYFRQKTFKKGVLRPLPYLVFAFVALIVIY